MTNQAKYIKLFTEYENWAKKRYKGMELYDIENELEFAQDKILIGNLRVLRNIMSHTSGLITIQKKAIDCLEYVIQKYCNAKTAIDIAIPISDLTYRNWDDSIKDLVEVMSKNDYTHVPILKQNKVWGLFSKDTIFNAYANKKIQSIESDATFMDIAEQIYLSFIKDGRYEFVGKRNSVNKIKNRFSELKKAGKRVDILFVTETGKRQEPLLGIITAWDIAAY